MRQDPLTELNHWNLGPTKLVWQSASAKLKVHPPFASTLQYLPDATLQSHLDQASCNPV